MGQISQADVARHLGLSAMTISRAARSMGRPGEPISENGVLALLVAGEINRIGLAWPMAVEIARRFEGEALYAARNPDHRAWIVFIDRPDRSFQVSCHSHTHLDAILTANPLARVLSLHEPVSHALEQLQHLKSLKEAG